MRERKAYTRWARRFLALYFQACAFGPLRFFDLSFAFVEQVAGRVCLVLAPTPLVYAEAVRGREFPVAPIVETLVLVLVHHSRLAGQGEWWSRAES